MQCSRVRCQIVWLGESDEADVGARVLEVLAIERFVADCLRARGQRVPRGSRQSVRLMAALALMAHARAAGLHRTRADVEPMTVREGVGEWLQITVATALAAS